ncbi:hypothetical protein [Bradyrhizobium sp.]|uniref:hypothetical protein n=1 Tax=Bradyrhizobium sp. TaxID=376 RepID=UPI003C752A9D
MGALVADGYVPHVQEQLNRRFIGEALTEMIGFQKEFKLFSPQHSLISSFTLLNIAPVEEKDRVGFLKYLHQLTRTSAEVDGNATKLSGHDQIVASLQENLECNRPLPVYFTYHPSGGARGVVQITAKSQPLSFSSTRFLTISVPTLRMDRPKAGARKK